MGRKTTIDMMVDMKIDSMMVMVGIDMTIDRMVMVDIDMTFLMVDMVDMIGTMTGRVLMLDIDMALALLVGMKMMVMIDTDMTLMVDMMVDMIGMMVGMMVGMMIGMMIVVDIDYMRLLIHMGAGTRMMLMMVSTRVDMMMVTMIMRMVEKSDMMMMTTAMDGKPGCRGHIDMMMMMLMVMWLAKEAAWAVWADLKCAAHNMYSKVCPLPPTCSSRAPTLSHSTHRSVR